MSENHRLLTEENNRNCTGEPEAICVHMQIYLNERSLYYYLLYYMIFEQACNARSELFAYFCL